jgi:hypothetical protein
MLARKSAKDAYRPMEMADEWFRTAELGRRSKAATTVLLGEIEEASNGGRHGNESRTPVGLQTAYTAACPTASVRHSSLVMR